MRRRRSRSSQDLGKRILSAGMLLHTVIIRSAQVWVDANHGPVVYALAALLALVSAQASLTLDALIARLFRTAAPPPAPSTPGQPAATIRVSSNPSTRQAREQLDDTFVLCRGSWYGPGARRRSPAS